MLIEVTEGELDFHPPSAGKPCKTWYQVHGNLKGCRRPLVVLHGGPGSPSNYLLPLADIVSSHNIPVVLYDQIGGGKSTHLPEKMGDAAFWTTALFLDELNNLLTQLGIKENYDILGHSWGGMLGASLAITQPQGLQRLVIADSPASMITWVEVANKLREKLPQDVQDTLKKHEDDGTTDSAEYEAAVGVFYARHVCRIQPMPENLAYCFQAIKEEPTVMLTMNGPSEFYVTGNLKDWTIVDDLHRIIVPTLLINGRYDEAQDEVMEPHFRKIAKVKWVQFAESSHMPQFEERERYTKVVGDFLIS